MSRRSDASRRLGQTHTDLVELVGEVRATDLDGGSFQLRLEDATKVPAKFTPEQEEVVTDALREHATRSLRVCGCGEFSLPEGKLLRILSIDDLALQKHGGRPYDHLARPIWEIALGIGRSVPDEEWAKLPTDTAANLDHYLYGAPEVGSVCRSA